MASEVFSTQQVVVVTVAAGHANHHFAETTRDKCSRSCSWLDFEAQIKHKKALLDVLLLEQKGVFQKVYLVGHSIGAYVCTALYERCNLKDRVDSELLLLMPYIRHSNLPASHKRKLELFQAYDPVSTRLVCLLLSVLAVLLPVAVKKFLVQQYVTLPHDISSFHTATNLFTPRMICNHFHMVSTTYCMI
jgi:alpha-beta hydrolase superfamily lysophospholipase